MSSTSCSHSRGDLLCSKAKQRTSHTQPWEPVPGTVERNPGWESCSEVKAMLRYALRLAGTSEGLSWPGWAALGSPGTLAVAHPHPLHSLSITGFWLALTAGETESLHLKLFTLTGNTDSGRKKRELGVDQDCDLFPESRAPHLIPDELIQELCNVTCYCAYCRACL